MMAVAKQDSKVDLDTLVTLFTGEDAYKQSDVVSFLLQTLQDLNIKEKKEQQLVVRKLNSLLSSPEESWIGFCMLKMIIKFLDADDLSENTGLWLRSVIQVVSKGDCNPFVQLMHRLLQQLLKLSRVSDDIAREVALTGVPSVLQVLCRDDVPVTKEYLGSLYACLYFYPGPCGTFRSKIQKKCLEVWMHHDSSLCKRSCLCLSSLPRCGSSGEKDEKYSDRWKLFFCSVLTEIHDLMECITSLKVESEYSSESAKKGNVFINFHSLPVPKKEPAKSIFLTKKVVMLFEIAGNLVLQGFSALVVVPMRNIIEVLSCVLGVGYLFKQSKIFIEQFYLSLCKPDIILAALKFSCIMYAQLGTLLLPYSFTLTQLLMNSLEYLQTERQGNSHSSDIHEELQKQMYQAILNWFTYVANVSIHGQFTQTVVTAALRDIDLISLGRNKSFVPGKASSSSLSKKAKRKRLQKEVVASGLENTVSPSFHSEVARLALLCLQSIIQCQGPLLKLPILKEILSRTITIASKVLGPEGQGNLNITAPYGCSKCRYELCKVLVSIMHLYHPYHSCPLRILFHLLHRGSRDQSDLVASFCIKQLLSADSVLHPFYPLVREECKQYSEAESSKSSESTEHHAGGNVSTRYMGITNDSFRENDQGVVSNLPRYELGQKESMVVLEELNAAVAEQESTVFDTNLDRQEKGSNNGDVVMKVVEEEEREVETSAPWNVQQLNKTSESTVVEPSSTSSSMKDNDLRWPLLVTSVTEQADAIPGKFSSNNSGKQLATEAEDNAFESGNLKRSRHGDLSPTSSTPKLLKHEHAAKEGERTQVETEVYLMLKDFVDVGPDSSEES